MRNRRWRRRFLRDLIVGDRDAGTIPAKHVKFTTKGAYWLGMHVDRFLVKINAQIDKQEARKRRKSLP